jgi:Flp pilus assembly protein TadG
MISRFTTSFARLAERFRRSERGNVALIFAVSLIPMLAATGSVVDYTRAAMARSQLQDALDSTALFLSKDATTPSLSQTQLNAKAKTYFNVNYTNKDAIPSTVTLTPVYSATGPSVTVGGTTTVPTDFMSVLGIATIPIGATSTATWGHQRLRVALVLDNTGSMAQDGKITALKTATANLLTQLQGAVSVAGDVYVSIIPFVKDVNVNNANYTASWENWIDWSLMIPSGYSTPASSLGPGATCPWTGGNHCVTAPGGGSNTATIPSSGTYKGDFCPSGAIGCWNSVASTSTSTQTVGPSSGASCSGLTSCSCTGSGKNKTCTGTLTTTTYAHNWFVDPTQWNGCVTDRGASLASSSSTGPDQTYYDATNSPTDVSAEQYSSCPQPMMALTYNWTSLNNLVTNMVANGSTNQPIGLVWGWQSLIGGGPFPAAPAMDPAYQYKQVIIELSDGLNTQDRWYGDGSNTSTQVDSRMYYGSATPTGTCVNAKNAGIIIYTVQVNTGGDPTSTLLQNCASDPSMFFQLTSASQIITTFQAIGTALSDLRLSI